VSGKISVDWLAWWQLMRVANVFTAISNVIAGYLLTQPTEIALLPLLLVVMASACLYIAGMVLNDVCDAKIDARERPTRPIPSGRVRNAAAQTLLAFLIWGGICSALVASVMASKPQCAKLVFLLAGAVISYNLGPKNIVYRAICMGLCRTLNVLLGASLAASLLIRSQTFAPWQYAFGIGLYTAGISVIANREAGIAKRGELIVGATAVLGGIITIALLPLSIEFVSVTMWGWLGLYAILFILVGSVACQLLSRRDSQLIGPSVVALIQMFILLDAMAAALARGWPAGLAVMSLYLPMRMLSRKAPMT
jgi:4-hydroxybenzoate polyprenyltransferase